MKNVYIKYMFGFGVGWFSFAGMSRYKKRLTKAGAFLTIRVVYDSYISSYMKLPSKNLSSLSFRTHRTMEFLTLGRELISGQGIEEVKPLTICIEH